MVAHPGFPQIRTCALERIRRAGCVRFAAGIAPGPRKTRFRLLAKLYQVRLVTHRIPTKGFDDASYIASSFPKLCLTQQSATGKWSSGCPKTEHLLTAGGRSVSWFVKRSDFVAVTRWHF